MASNAANPANTIDRATLRSNGGGFVTTGGGTQTLPGLATHRSRRCCDVHCNSLWSLWYGILVVLFQAYIVYKSVSRFMIYLALPWPDRKQPYLELNVFVGLVGAGVVLLPFFFISFMFKIGNLANDGYKLGYHLSACPMDPPSLLAQSGGFVRNAWHHGGPTAPFIHIISAFCFLLPKIIIDARLIDVGFLSKDHTWKTDLDWLIPPTDRKVILHFLTGGMINATATTTQAPYLHPAAQIRAYLEAEENWWPCSPEFINYGFALLVFSVRYPAVYWNTNKGFSFLFSLQLLANSVQHLMSLGGFSIMYKVQVLGPQNVLHKYEPFLLNTPICLLLFILSSIIVTSSSCVLYMYGYQKFMAFLDAEREKHSISVREGRTTLWSYFAHCSAMCVLIALAVCNGPLLYDYTLIYKGSLDGTVLSCVIATIMHLFLWIVIWLFLTIKQNWRFKLRVTVGRAIVRNARSIKLVNDIELTSTKKDPAENAMLIVAFGKTFSVSESGPKKLIMNTLARAAIERDKVLDGGGDERTQLLPGQSETNVSGTGQHLSPAHQSNNTLGRHKVAFDSLDGAGTQSPRPSVCGSNVNQSPRMMRNRCEPGPHIPEEHHHLHADEENFIKVDEDDCDELPPPPGHESGSTSPTQAQMMVSPRPAPRRTQISVQHPDLQDIHTPRSNRSVDSGLPHDDITPRSDSLSTASSASPPDQHQTGLSAREIQQQHRKSTSLDDMNIAQRGVPPQTHWKSYSLQRCTEVPPPETPNLPPQGNDPNALYGSGNFKNPDGTLVIRRQVQSRAPEEEDPYGRCTNMKLTSFSEQQIRQQQLLQLQPGSARDPRIIDLTQSTSTVSSTTSLCSTPRQGSPVHYPLVTQVTNFNTLPANNCPNGGRLQATSPSPVSHNTLPARVNAGSPGAPSSGGRGSFAGPTGRHFKPFDHRKMNPMAEIREDSTWTPVVDGNGIYAQLPQNTTLVVHKNNHVPHMPSELRHTNYSNSNQQGQKQTNID